MVQGLLLQNDSEKLHSMNLLLYMAPIAICWLVPATFMMEGNVAMMVVETAKTDPFFLGLLFANATMAYLTNLTNFLVSGAFSPSISVVNQTAAPSSHTVVTPSCLKHMLLRSIRGRTIPFTSLSLYACSFSGHQTHQPPHAAGNLCPASYRESLLCVENEKIQQHLSS